MGQILDPRKALEHEFVCYFNGDELPVVHSEAFLATLAERAWASGLRLRHAVGEDKVAELIGVLQSLKEEPEGTLMSVIAGRSQVSWQDDPQDWAVFQRLVEQLIKFLQQGPGPRPAGAHE
jgi:hypothetical protein